MIDGIVHLLQAMEQYPDAALGLAFFTIIFVGGLGNMFRRR
jgi:hypothetical protein